MRLTLKGFLLRGLAAGAAGGLATALFIRFVTEVQIGYALRFEDATGIGLPPGEISEMTVAGWNSSFDKLVESLR